VGILQSVFFVRSSDLLGAIHCKIYIGLDKNNNERIKKTLLLRDWYIQVNENNELTRNEANRNSYQLFSI
jgi:hypothetical protein